jgi:hypothetical protein
MQGICRLFPAVNKLPVHASFRGFSVTDASGLLMLQPIITDYAADVQHVPFASGAATGVSAIALSLHGAAARVNMQVSVFEWADAAASHMTCTARVLRIGESLLCFVLTRRLSDGAAVNAWPGVWAFWVGGGGGGSGRDDEFGSVAAAQLSAAPARLHKYSVWAFQPEFGPNISFAISAREPAGTQVLEVRFGGPTLPRLKTFLAGARGTLSWAYDVVDAPDATSLIVCDPHVAALGAAQCTLVARRFGRPIWTAWSMVPSLADDIGSAASAFVPTLPSATGFNLTFAWTAPAAPVAARLSATSVDGVSIASGGARILVYAVPDATSTLSCPASAEWGTTVQCAVRARYQGADIVSHVAAFRFAVGGAGGAWSSASASAYGTALTLDVTLNGDTGVAVLSSGAQSLAAEAAIEVWARPDEASSLSDWFQLF